MDVFKKYLRRTLRALFSLRELSESEESPMMGELGVYVVVADEGKKKGEKEGTERVRTTTLERAWRWLC